MKPPSWYSYEDENYISTAVALSASQIGWKYFDPMFTSRKKQYLASIVCGMVPGLIKEFVDRYTYQGNFDHKDLTWSAAGVLIGVTFRIQCEL